MVFGINTFREFMAMRGVFDDYPEVNLYLIENWTFDGRIQELVYRPVLHM